MSSVISMLESAKNQLEMQTNYIRKKITEYDVTLEDLNKELEIAYLRFYELEDAINVLKQNETTSKD